MSGGAFWQLPDHLAELAEMGGDDVLQEILSLFLADTPERIARIASAMEREDPPAVAREGHGLKGGCLQIGADSLAALAAELEAGAAPERWPALREQISREYESIACQVRERCGLS